MLSPLPGRLLLLDALRGAAVLGIYWIGVAVFGLPYGTNALPTLLGEANSLNLAIWASTEVLLEGAMRGLFSMMFGASALMLLEGSDRDGVALVDRFYRRNLLLILFGLVHAYLLLWPHDVLYAYGLLGMFLFPLRKAPAVALFIAGVLLQAFADVELDWATVVGWLQNVDASAGGAAEAPLGAGMAAEEGARFRFWLEAQLQQDLATYRAGYLDIFLAQAEEVAAAHSIGMYKKHLFEIGGMMLIGMALYRFGVLTGARSARFYLLLALGGLGVGGWLRGIDVYHAFTTGFDPLSLVAMAEVDYDLGRLPVALGWIGLIGLLCRWPAATRPLGWLAATGRLALTHYISQTVFSITLFYGFGFGLFGELERWQLALLCVGVWLFQIGFSHLWLIRFRYGPLEWVWRSLTYGEWQPLRISGQAAPSP